MALVTSVQKKSPREGGFKPNLLRCFLRCWFLLRCSRFLCGRFLRCCFLNCRFLGYRHCFLLIILSVNFIFILRSIMRRPGCDALKKNSNNRVRLSRAALFKLHAAYAATPIASGPSPNQRQYPSLFSALR